MKVSRKQIRAIIKEELNRELPISYYSDEMIMHEGLLDWLGNLFGKLVGFFTGAADKGASRASTTYETAFGDSRLQKIAKKHGLDGLGEPGDFKHHHLDMEDKKHRLVFFEATAEILSSTAAEETEALQQAAKIPDWTPKDDSEEAAKEWQEKNGDVAAKFWEVVGSVGWGCGWLGNEMQIKGGNTAAGKLESAGESGNPAEASEALIAGLEWMIKVFDKGVSDGSEFASDAKSLLDAELAAATAVAKAIAESGKEQQKESLELRKLINTLVHQVIKG